LPKTSFVESAVEESVVSRLWTIGERVQHPLDCQWRLRLQVVLMTFLKFQPFCEPQMRSPLLMSRTNSALLVIDVQEKLVPAIENHERIVWNIRRLVDAANLLGVPVLATEQYPKGLGNTVEPLSSRLASVPEKSMFSCRECADIFEDLRNRSVTNLLLTGIESHVCVQQTALDCVTAGFNVFLAADAVGSRNDMDHEVALCRMEASGCFVTTTESAMFEWCETSQAPEFKSISKLVQEELVVEKAVKGFS
jgi:nicotinamidase-related amidase